MNGENRAASNPTGEEIFGAVIGLCIVGILFILLASWIHSKATSAGIQSTLPWEPSRSAS